MGDMKKFLKKLLGSDGGATAIEYGLIAAGITLLIASVIFALGTDLLDKFTAVDTFLKH